MEVADYLTFSAFSRGISKAGLELEPHFESTFTENWFNSSTDFLLDLHQEPRAVFVRGWSENTWSNSSLCVRRAVESCWRQGENGLAIQCCFIRVSAKGAQL